MKIKMFTIQAGPGGVRRAGEVHDISPAEAQELIKGGYAVQVEDDVPAVNKPRIAVKPKGRNAAKKEADDPADV